MMDFLETMEIAARPATVTPKVLIVDDDPLVCERLEALVAAANFQVRSVPSGAAALASLRNDFTPIVITDLHMPDMDGLTLCRTIRNEQFDGYVYVVLLTSQDAEEAILTGLAAGADDYVSKRTSSAQLIARLRTAQRILGLEYSLRAVITEKNRLATTDVLTGASNRRYFTRHVGRELKRIERLGGQLSVLLLDIDHFKRVNDGYGHAIGDEVLREFALRIAQGLTRSSDWYARLGGEEFAVVLPGTDLRGAQLVADRIRLGIAARPIDTLSGPIPVTVSIGVGGIEALAPDAEISTDALLEIADRCLYVSKDSGRNRVTVADRAVTAA